MKERVAIVTGPHESPSEILPLTPLANAFDVKLFTLDSSLADWRSPFALSIVSSDGQGAYKDIDRVLGPFSYVLLKDLTRLHSYQVLRHCQGRGKVLFSYATDMGYNGYEEFPHVTKCLQGVQEYSTLILAPHPLCLPQGSESKSLIISPLVSQASFAPSTSLFLEESLSLKEKDTLLVHPFVSDHSPAPSLILQAMALEKSEGDAPLSKVVFFSPHLDQKSLKYAAYDLGVGNRTYFVHRDIDTLLPLAVRAADFLIYDRSSHPSLSVSFPFLWIQSLVHEALPLCFSQDAVTQSLLQPIGWSFAADSDPKILSEVLSIKREHPTVWEKKTAHSLHVLSTFSSDESSWVDALAKECQKQNKAKETYHLDAHASPNTKLKIMNDLLLHHASPTADMWLQKGLILVELNLPEEAIDAFEQSLKLDASQPRAFLELGHIARTHASHKEALTFFKKAYAIDPRNKEACFGMGGVLEKCHCSFEALSWFERGLCLEEALPEKPIRDFARLCLSLGAQEVTLKSLRRVMDVLGEHPLLLTTLEELSENA